MRIDLTGRVALVTGSGRGIGKAIALALAESGADLVLNDLNLPPIERVRDEISKLGRKAIALKADVSKKSEVEDAVRRSVTAYGKVDILVNNAGTVVRKPMEDYEETDWDRVMSVNLKGVFNLCQAVGKHMIAERFGRIINIASVMGMAALPPRASYVASKGGIIALTRDLAGEWAKHNITVNSISPGWVKTEMTESYLGQEDVRRFLLERIPLGRFAEPQDVANLALLLASDQLSYITGQNIAVDGGWTAQ